MTVVTAPKGEPDQERLGDEGFEQDQDPARRGGRDPKIKPGQEFTGYIGLDLGH